jgi:hypothetical protein
MKIKLERKSMVKWPTPSSFCKSTRIKLDLGKWCGVQPWHKIYVLITIVSITKFLQVLFWIWQFIFTSIQVVILNHVKYNDYSSCNNMKKFPKIFGSLLRILRLFTQDLKSGYEFQIGVFPSWNVDKIDLFFYISFLNVYYITIHRLHEKYLTLNWIENL